MFTKDVLDATVTVFLFLRWDDQIGGTRSTRGKCVEDFSPEARHNLLSASDNYTCNGNVKMNLK